MLLKRFTFVRLLITHLANLTEGFQLSLTTNVFPRKQHKVVCNQCLYIECGKQHKVVCNQCLYIECGRPTTISSEVTD